MHKHEFCNSVFHACESKVNKRTFLFCLGLHDEKYNGYGGSSGGYSKQMQMQPMSSKPPVGGAAYAASTTEHFSYVKTSF